MRRLLLAVLAQCPASSPRVRVTTAWLTTRFLLPLSRLTLPLPSWWVSVPLRASVGVQSPSPRWSGWSASSRVSWRSPLPLFNSSLLAEVISQVQSSSQVSSNLALSRAFHRGRSNPSSSSPLTGPRLPSFARGRQSKKRSSSSSRSGGRKRFRGGKGGAPSSGPSGFRK